LIACEQLVPSSPTVETITRLIRPRLEGRASRLRGAVDAHPRRALAPAFAKAVVGARLARVWRRGKFFVADLEREGRAKGALVGTCG
jgi:formamidopyrimidine-DNA glycosylase